MSDPVSTRIVAITAGASGIGRVVAEAFLNTPKHSRTGSTEPDQPSTQKPKTLK